MLDATRVLPYVTVLPAPLVLCRVVVVLVVMVLAVVLALRGYPVGAITGPVLVLVAGAVAAADRLTGVPRVGPVLALPAP